MEDKEFLYKGLKKLEIEPSERSLEQLIEYREILVEWSEKINLTTILEKEEVFIKHFLDSATCISAKYIKKGAKVIDVGTGAGFPGIPIKILREDISLTLLDSLNKRILYLNDVLKRLKIEGVKTVHARAEEGGMSKEHREQYDVVVSRAVASLNVLLEYCVPYIAIGGYFLCQKGPSYKEEQVEAIKAAKTLGVELVEVKEYQLPSSEITHYILVYKKIRQTSSKYPRKPGKPASEPIK